MSYIGTEPKDIRSFGRTKFDYTATQGQTAFTGADDDGKVLAFTVGQIEVYVNGILMDDSDFTTTGTGTVTLASAANLNDVINIVSFESNIPDNDYVPASGGTFTGNVTHSGTLAAPTISGNVSVSGELKVNGNVGIDTGTITPRDVGASTLQIGGNGTRSAIKMHTSSSGIGGTDGLFLGYDSGPHFYILNSEANGDIKVGTNNSVDRLLIDASGRVTMPNQPSFHATLSSNQTGYNATTSSGTQDYIQYNSDIYDTGNNHSGGTFTAPVDGVYLFRAEAYANVGWSQSWWLVNGARAAGTDTVYPSSTSFAHSTAILKLSANDTVRYRGYISGATNATIYAHANHTWFRGMLIG